MAKMPFKDFDMRSKVPISHYSVKNRGDIMFTIERHNGAQPEGWWFMMMSQLQIFCDELGKCDKSGDKYGSRHWYVMDDESMRAIVYSFVDDNETYLCPYTRYKQTVLECPEGPPAAFTNGVFLTSKHPAHFTDAEETFYNGKSTEVFRPNPFTIKTPVHIPLVRKHCDMLGVWFRQISEEATSDEGFENEHLDEVIGKMQYETQKLIYLNDLLKRSKHDDTEEALDYSYRQVPTVVQLSQEMKTKYDLRVSRSVDEPVLIDKNNNLVFSNRGVRGCERLRFEDDVSKLLETVDRMKKDSVDFSASLTSYKSQLTQLDADQELVALDKKAAENEYVLDKIIHLNTQRFEQNRKKNLKRRRCSSDEEVVGSVSDDTSTDDDADDIRSGRPFRKRRWNRDGKKFRKFPVQYLKKEIDRDTARYRIRVKYGMAGSDEPNSDMETDDSDPTRPDYRLRDTPPLEFAPYYTYDLEKPLTVFQAAELRRGQVCYVDDTFYEKIWSSPNDEA